MFNAICVSTGKSASATLIHWALQPVAISEILRTTDSRILVIEFDFMSVFLPRVFGRLNRRQRSGRAPDGQGGYHHVVDVAPKTKSPSAEADGDCLIDN
jgi:hypothetical protein